MQNDLDELLELLEDPPECCEGLLKMIPSFVVQIAYRDASSGVYSNKRETKEEKKKCKKARKKLLKNAGKCDEYRYMSRTDWMPLHLTDVL